MRIFGIEDTLALRTPFYITKSHKLGSVKFNKKLELMKWRAVEGYFKIIGAFEGIYYFFDSLNVVFIFSRVSYVFG